MTMHTKIRISDPAYSLSRSQPYIYDERPFNLSHCCRHTEKSHLQLFLINLSSCRIFPLKYCLLLLFVSCVLVTMAVAFISSSLTVYSLVMPSRPHLPDLSQKLQQRLDHLQLVNDEQVKTYKKALNDLHKVLADMQENIKNYKPVPKSQASAKAIDIVTTPAKSVELLTIRRPRNETVAFMRDKVKKMMLHAWYGYKNYAWGENELNPLSKTGHNAEIFGGVSLGATIVDSMDTLYIMGLKKEYEMSREWITKLRFDVSTVVSVFEMNIRFLGAFLTMYSFTQDELFKTKAVELANRLLPAFDTPTGIPKALVNLKHGGSQNYAWVAGDKSILAEFGTLHMEFTYLSEVTGKDIYRKKVRKIREALKQVGLPSQGLYSCYLDPNSLQWGELHSTIAGMGDSFYEYLLKEYVRTNGQDMEAKTLYDNAMLAMEKHMFRRSPRGLFYVGDYRDGYVMNKFDHLGCFAGGMFALAANISGPQGSPYYEKWMKYSRDLTQTCHESYVTTTTHLGPESFAFTSNTYGAAVEPLDRRYIQRPETVESYFYLWRITKNPKYREWAWDVVKSLERYSRVEAGYSGIGDVTDATGRKDNVQQSFFLAETLKYLYLIFSDDDLLPLDRWVFNTEAHPLPIQKREVHLTSEKQSITTL